MKKMSDGIYQGEQIHNKFLRFFFFKTQHENLKKLANFFKCQTIFI